MGTGAEVPQAMPWSVAEEGHSQPPQPWGRSWLLGTTAGALWQVPPHPLWVTFSPGTSVATLPVEGACVPIRGFFFSLSLWLFILCRGGAGAWLRARATPVPCREEQGPRGKAVRGGGAGQGAPSSLAELVLLLTSTADLPLAATIFSLVKWREHHVPG